MNIGHGSNLATCDQPTFGPRAQVTLPQGESSRRLGEGPSAELPLGHSEHRSKPPSVEQAYQCRTVVPTVSAQFEQLPISRQVKSLEITTARFLLATDQTIFLCPTICYAQGRGGNTTDVVSLESSCSRHPPQNKPHQASQRERAGQPQLHPLLPYFPILFVRFNQPGNLLYGSPNSSHHGQPQRVLDKRPQIQKTNESVIGNRSLYAVPPSSSGPGHWILSPKTGVRLP